MKRFLALMVAFAVLLLSLCACSPSLSYNGTSEEFEGILDMIAEIPIATLGVSMTITARAVDLLDWCEATAMSGEDVAAQVKQAYDRLDAGMQEIYFEQITVTLNTVANLANDDIRANVLEAAGFSPKLTWSENAFSLAACIDDLL